MTSRGNVVVYGSDIRMPPLLDSNEPQMVLFKDAFGDPMVLFVRILSEDTWGMVTKGDADWNSMLVKYGFNELRVGTSIQDIITNNVDPYVETPQ
jgi:hypothetical protein